MGGRRRPTERRPKRLDLAWHSLETNQVGLHEFAGWSERVGAELMLALNLGTRGTLEALDLLEYTNIRAGSTLAEQRAANGSPDPFNVRMWCLGNEMDGRGSSAIAAPRTTASREPVAKAMRQMDPNLELVVCGSSNWSMPTFGTWERVVLEHTYDDIDFISGHSYYQERNGDRGSFLASAVDMDAFIETVIATADSVKAALRSERTIDISFDEWNVWYSDRFNESGKITDVNTWPYAPRLLEDQYSVTDAVVVGSLLICLLKHADRVKAACLAQLVNVIAPIMTEPGGPAWRQTISSRSPSPRAWPGARWCGSPSRARATTRGVRSAAGRRRRDHRQRQRRCRRIPGESEPGRRRPSPSMSAHSGRSASVRASRWRTTTRPPRTPRAPRPRRPDAEPVGSASRTAC